MTFEELKKEFDTLNKELENLLFTKGKEYSNSDDALANFKKGSDIGITPEQKLFVYLDKHFCSIQHYLKRGKIESNESIEGRINDAINYLFLLRCLIKENKKPSTEPQQLDELADFINKNFVTGC